MTRERDLEEFLTLRFAQRSVNVLENIVGRFIRVNLSDFAERSIMVDDGHRVVHVSVEALLQAFEVVIGAAAARLSTFQTPLNALVRRTLEEKDEEKVDLLRHLPLPALQVVFVAREAIDEEFVVASLLK